MKRLLELTLLLVMVSSCSKEGSEFVDPDPPVVDDEYVLGHDMIVLGDRLENPYKTDNVKSAYSALYPTRSRDDIQTTDLYVRFLPKTSEEYALLKSLGVDPVDHPVDYAIVTDGDYYHDPSIAEDEITWQYAVVPKDFVFPDIEYQIIDECFIADGDLSTRSGENIDWEALEAEAYRITGNGDMLLPQTKADRVYPQGRITIVDEHVNGGKIFGVAGVRVRCNTFVKFARAYTDRDGYYKISTKFSSKLMYRLVFTNESGFGIGFNKVLVPASTSALGKGEAEGLSVTIDTNSDRKLFNRCVVNNAAYDYISRCTDEDMGIAPPPSDLRIWLFNSLEASSAVMIHHGAFVAGSFLEKYLGAFVEIIKYFAPDITIGTKNATSYRDLYSAVCHELSHASHFTTVGTEYWNKYIDFIMRSYISTGGTTYGNGTEEGSGFCEVGEMWGYYNEAKMYQERYGGSVPTFGTSFWFKPQIYRYLDDRGVKRAEIFKAMNTSATDRASLKNQLMTVCPGKKTVIEQAFNRY